MSTQTENEQPDRLQLTLIAYGSSASDPNDDSRFTGQDQRRVEIHTTPLIPADLIAPEKLDALTAWAQNIARGLCLDMKHSQKWHCEFCDKLARETSMNFASWMHLTPPTLKVYLHLMCDCEPGSPCAERLRGVEDNMATLSGASQHLSKPYVPKDGMVYPAAASCVYCMSEETVDKTLSRCSKCKFTRYCGPDCQREDWPRHKGSCRLIQDVIWVWK